jgi:hypothetical protein
MTIVLTPNKEQYNSLNGYHNNSSELLFVKDGSDAWIVGEEVLQDPNFAEIHEKLKELKRIKYTPLIDATN